MATLVDDRLTVGIWPLPGTAKRADLLAGVVTPGVGSFELRPLAFENMAEAVENGDISSVDDYISPYQTFTLTVTAIPTLPGEVIVSVSFDPLPPIPAFTPFKAIIEEPNPTTLVSRTGAEEPQEIVPSPNWEPPLVNEEYIQTLGGVTTATIGGYYTEKAFYDREWYLRFSNCIARFSYLGIQYIKPDDVPQGVPLDLQELFSDPKIARPLPSNIRYDNWYPQTKADAQAFDSPQMPFYFETCDGIISYKATEIRKLRYYYIVFIESLIGSSTKLTWFPCFMTVQYNSKFAQQRLTAAIAATQAADRKPLPLQIPTNA